MKPRLPVRICGTGSYVPEEVVTNQHFVDYLDTSEEWIVTRTGIRERRRAASDETTSSLAAKAAQIALDDANLKIDDIDIIICATATGDCQWPSTAAYVQGKLKGKNIPAFDISAACAGFLHAATVGAGLLAGGLYKRVLVIGAEVLTRFTNPEDRNTAILLGDGAGAMILAHTQNPDQGITHYELGCDGTKTKLIWVPAGGSLQPASETTVAENLHYMRMRGREVFKFVVLKMEELIDRALEETGVEPSELKLVIPHQSNLRILEAARERLGLPPEKLAVNIHKYGNTSSASIPMALDEARRNGTVKEGDTILLVGIGAGICWGSMIIRL